MALEVEDGTSKSNAESYLSVADADTYFSNYSNTTWSAATTAAKESSLRKATQFLDATFAWMGVVSELEQALGWPREGVYDPERRQFNGTVPKRVKDATAELAVEALSTDLIKTKTRDDQIRRVQAGSVSAEYETNASFQTSFALAERLVAPLVTGRYGGGANIGLVKT